MANTLSVQDAYLIINDLYKMATGRENIKAVDTRSFVAVGETMLRTGVEPTLKALSQWCGKTYFEMEKYRSGVFRSSLRITNDGEPSHVRSSHCQTMRKNRRIGTQHLVQIVKNSLTMVSRLTCTRSTPQK